MILTTKIILVWLIDFVMATGPIIGYLAQYRLIKMLKQIGSFSIDICGILLFANILRINFYLFQKFQNALLVQSILMITMQIVLLHQCSKCRQFNQDVDGNGNERGVVKRGESFWRWKSFEKYGVTIFLFIFISFSLSKLVLMTEMSKTYGELIGLLALMSQSVIVLPQIIRNIKKQSTKGLSYILVGLNIIGDIQKLVYFLILKQPFQFILCAVIQIFLDSFVILQIIYYLQKSQNLSSSKNQKNQQIQSQNNGNYQQLNKKDSQQNSDQILNKYDVREQIKEENININININGQQSYQKNKENQLRLTKSRKINNYQKLKEQVLEEQEKNPQKFEYDNKNIKQQISIQHKNKQDNKKQQLHTSLKKIDLQDIPQQEAQTDRVICVSQQKIQIQPTVAQSSQNNYQDDKKLPIQ